MSDNQHVTDTSKVEFLDLDSLEQQVGPMSGSSAV